MKLDNITPGISAPSTLWNKYTDYVLLENENDIFIIPSGDSQELFYTPFDNAETLLKDFMNTAVNIFQGHGLNYRSWDKKIKFDIGREFIEIAKRYGLLGYFNVLSRVLLSENQNDYIDLWKQFYPTLPSEGIIVVSGKYMTKEDPAVLRRNYAESITHFIDGIGFIYKYSILWNFYESNNMKPNDIYVQIPEDEKLNDLDHVVPFYDQEVTWSDRLSRFINVPVNIGISRASMNDWNTNFSFESLFDILCLALLQKNSSANKLRFCGKCKKPFIQDSPKQSYCSIECRRIASVNRSREKVKQAKRLFSEGFSCKEISVRCNTTVDQVKKWIEGE